MLEHPPMSVQGLSVVTSYDVPIISDIDIEIREPSILAIAGESGSGKTTASLAMLGYARAGARISAGSVHIEGTPITSQNPRQLRALRGRLVSYLPQDPATALNPSMRIGQQVLAVYRSHLPGSDGVAALMTMFERLHLPTSRDFLRRYPHQLSGGQQQRVAIAKALICQPRVVVLDEPTTALDVVTQRAILTELRRLRDELGITMIYVSHNLAVVAELADRIAVMYAGRLVEIGSAQDVLLRPRHPYTKALVEAVPDHIEPREVHGIPGTMASLEDLPAGCAFWERCPIRVMRCATEVPPLYEVGAGHQSACHEHARTGRVIARPVAATVADGPSGAVLEVRDMYAHYRTPQGLTTVCRGISFDIHAGTTLALVGESGSGKTTAARCIVGLHARTSGQILLSGKDLRPTVDQRTADERRRMQMVFQNPYASLNPAITVGNSIARQGNMLLGKKQSQRKVRELIDLVRLPERVLSRYPAELSGGERQRAAIARALMGDPDVLVCDEITSALDVSVQAAVIELLNDLRARSDLAMLLISHDLGVVATLADRIAVLEHGEIREQGPVGIVVAKPTDGYTKSLIAAVPRVTITN